MAILGRLFSKKDGRKTNNDPPLATSASSDFDTLEAERMASTELSHSNHLNSFYTNAAASSSKLKVSFLNKKAKVTSSQPAAAPEPTQRHQYPIARSEAAVDSRHSSPAPATTSRSSNVFRLHRGPQGFSTHSLPTRADDMPEPKVQPAPLPKKSGGFISWARERNKSHPLPPSPTRATDDSSFNLRAFRHVRSPSLGSSTMISLSNSTTSVLPPERPRPRGDSTTSDSSQRISVAAFREMQARRSAATSPTPSALTEMQARRSLATSPTPSATRSTFIANPATNPNSHNLKPPSRTNASPRQSVLQKQTLERSAPTTKKSALRSSTSSDTSESTSSDEDSPPEADRKSKSTVGHRPSAPVKSPAQLVAQQPNAVGRPRASTSIVPIKQNAVGVKGHSPQCKHGPLIVQMKVTNNSND
jgi:hypothetical protein